MPVERAEVAQQIIAELDRRGLGQAVQSRLGVIDAALRDDRLNTVTSIPSDPAKAFLNIALSGNETIPVNIGQIFPEAGMSPTTRKRGVNINAAYRQENGSAGNTQLYRGVEVGVTYGDGVDAPVGAVIGLSSSINVRSSGDPLNEHGMHFGYINYGAIPDAGRAWLTDWAVHGAIGQQQSLLQGAIAHINNHYNGSPADSIAAGMVVSTGQGKGAGVDGPHAAAATYPVDAGFWVLGKATGGTGHGFERGLLVGGTGSGWNIGESTIGTGVEVVDWVNQALFINFRKAGATGPGINMMPSDAGQVLIQSKRFGEANARVYIDELGNYRMGPDTAGWDTQISRGAAGVVRIQNALGLPDSSSPGGGTDAVRLYGHKNGSGKMELYAVMPTGSPILIAAEA